MNNLRNNFIKKYKHEVILFCFAIILQAVVFILTLKFGSAGFLWTSDAEVYFDLASNLLDHGGFFLEPTLGPQSLRTPVFPLFVAALLKPFGSLLFVMVFQGLLASAVVVLVYRFARLFVSANTSLITAILFLLESRRLQNSSQLMSEPLFMALFIGSLMLLFLYVRSRSRPFLLIFSSLLFGLAILTRPIVQFVPLLIALFLLVYGWREISMKKRIWDGIAFVLITIIVLFPWSFRNYYHFNTYSILSIVGANALTGHASLFLEYKHGQENAFIGLVREVVEELEYEGVLGLSKELSFARYGIFDFENQPHLLKKSYSIISEDPLFHTGLIVRRMATFFVESSASRSYSTLLYKLELPDQIFYPYLYFGGRIWWSIITLFGFIGFIWLLRDRRIRLSVLFLAILCFYFAFFSAMNRDHPRLRLPVNPIIFLFAASGFFALKNRDKHDTRLGPLCNESIESCLVCSCTRYVCVSNKGILQKGGQLVEARNVMCFGCGLVYLNPRPTQSSIRDWYRDKYILCRGELQAGTLSKYSVEKLTGIEKGREISQFIGNFLNSDSRVLIVGSGLGFVANYIQNNLHARVDCVEPSAESADFSRCEYSLNVFVGTLEDFLASKSKKNEYDVVLMHHVLEHLHNPLSVLSDVSRLMKTNGILYIEVPNVYDIKKPVNQFFDVLHTMSFTPNSLKRLLKESGYKIVRVNTGKPKRIQLLATNIDSSIEEIKDKYLEQGKFVITTPIYLVYRRIVDFLYKLKHGGYNR